jgi:hypothetical protein
MFVFDSSLFTDRFTGSFSEPFQLAMLGVCLILAGFRLSRQGMRSRSKGLRDRDRSEIINTAAISIGTKANSHRMAADWVNPQRLNLIASPGITHPSAPAQRRQQITNEPQTIR